MFCINTGQSNFHTVSWKRNSPHIITGCSSLNLQCYCFPHHLVKSWEWKQAAWASVTHVFISKQPKSKNVLIKHVSSIDQVLCAKQYFQLSAGHLSCLWVPHWVQLLVSPNPGIHVREALLKLISPNFLQWEGKEMCLIPQVTGNLYLNFV